MIPSPVTPYVGAPSAKYVAKVQALTPELESGLNEDELSFGKWEVEISDWRRLCVPHGWMACFCPSVALAQVSARLDPGSFCSTLGRMTLFYVAIALVILFTLLFGPMAESLSFLIVGFNFMLYAAIWIAHWISQQRTLVRGRFQIPGSGFDDRVKSLCCGPCVLAQMATQTKLNKAGACNFSEPDALPAYIR